MTNRRQIIQAALFIAAAPAIVRASSMMPVKAWKPKMTLWFGGWQRTLDGRLTKGVLVSLDELDRKFGPENWHIEGRQDGLFDGQAVLVVPGDKFEGYGFGSCDPAFPGSGHYTADIPCGRTA